MRAIINGLRYDTDKATLIGEASASVSVRDLAHWSAGLYRAPRSGRFFLAGRGGPMTRWARRVDGSTFTGSSGIVPLERHEALEWAERYLTVEDIERGFSDAVEEA